jgi:hypothetical protein
MMKFLGAFDAGLPNVSIIKLLDPTDEVLCYVLMPDPPADGKSTKKNGCTRQIRWVPSVV